MLLLRRADGRGERRRANRQTVGARRNRLRMDRVRGEAVTEGGRRPHPACSRDDCHDRKIGRAHV